MFRLVPLFFLRREYVLTYSLPRCFHVAYLIALQRKKGRLLSQGVARWHIQVFISPCLREYFIRDICGFFPRFWTNSTKWNELFYVTNIVWYTLLKRPFFRCHIFAYEACNSFDELWKVCLPLAILSENKRQLVKFC